MSHQFKVLSLSGFVVLFAACGLRAASYIGYTEPLGDNTNNAYDNGVKITSTATQAQVSFLNHLQGYYYEDFQEAATNPKTKPNSGNPFLKLTDLTNNTFPFAFKSHGNLGGETLPAGSLTASVPSEVTFQVGPIQPNNERGVYDGTDMSHQAYELAPAIPGTILSDANNWFASVEAPNPGDTLTINIAPGQYAVGLMLNDIVTPSKNEVTIDFNDGSEMELTNGITAGTGTGNNPTTNGTLGDNNVLFFGYIGTKSISNVKIYLGNDGITLDNVYVSNSVPLPKVSLSFLVLMSLIGLGWTWRTRRPNLLAN